jgi:hypothetical protein
MRLFMQYTKALRWFKTIVSHKVYRKPFIFYIIEEHENILYNKNKSLLIKKKENFYSFAMENRAFTHYRWY